MTTLLTLTLSGSALTLLLLALRYLLLKRMPSTVYYYAWLLVLLRFVLPLPGFVPVPGAEAEPASSAVPFSQHFFSEASAPATQVEFTLSPASPEDSAALPVSESGSPSQVVNSSPSPFVAVSRSLRWHSPALWLSLWGLGALLCFGGTVFSYLRFTRRLRPSLRIPAAFVRGVYRSLPGRKPALYLCCALKTPLMYGVVHPRIVLPERSYDEELLTNILRHELMHYRRKDTLYKWVSVAVLSLHWFNPLSWIARREINRACELSCDEMLLRSMSRSEKQAYGNTLLNMAASSALPAGVVATTFSTEKKNLKERLEQIMHYKKSRVRTLAAMLALIVLFGCSLAAGPASAGNAEISTDSQHIVRVSTVDEFLAALASDTVIELAPGTYDLSSASNYAVESQSPYYRWTGVYSEDGGTAAELELRQLENLTIRGSGMTQTIIAAVPRYANVLKLSSCRGVTLEQLTAGHTTEPGFCAGGVLSFDLCSDMTVNECGLYGCGTIGVQAKDCNSLTVTACDVYECSYGALEVRSCRNIRMEDCDVHHHGTRAGQGGAMNLFDLAYSDGAVIRRNRIHDNNVQYLLHSNYTQNAFFLSNEVENNAIVTCGFALEEYGVTIDGCSFRDNELRSGWLYGNGVYANDLAGNLLDSDALAAMTWQDLDPGAAVTPLQPDPAMALAAGASVEVTSVDEFLSALGPDRTIVLNAELFDLSAASSYGSIGGEYYYWAASYDGPELVIHDLSGLTIRSASSDPAAVTLAAIPRYANVLNFRDCENVSLLGFTAGHTKEPGSCSGGVLNLQNCSGITVDGMRLYGCGILGLQTSSCTSLDVLRTEIYECSQGAGMFFQTDGIRFGECRIHDVPSPALRFTQCGDITWNDAPVSGMNGEFDISAEGELMPYEFHPEEETVYSSSLEDLVNPFADEPSHHYQAGFPQTVFAAAVQKAIADGNWEALADRMAFPVQVYVSGQSFPISSREVFLDAFSDENFTQFIQSTFNEDFRKLIASDDLSEFGECVFGETCLDHRIAFACAGNRVAEDNLFIMAISFDGPLWPGRGAYVQVLPDVPPTPQP